MKTTTLVLTDQVNCKFLGLDPITRQKVNDALKFMVPYARHTPQFKLKRWDGKVSFGSLGGTTFINMLDRVLPIITGAGYTIELDDQRPENQFGFPVIEDDFVADRVWPPGHNLAGLPIMLRDYQVEAINGFFRNHQSVQQIATGSGKTLITACMSLAIEPLGRSVVIVPSKDLVRQTEADYRMLGLDVGVFYGDRKEYTHQHTICTWQSLSVFSKNSKKGTVAEPIDAFLAGVVCVMVDEVHSAKGNELKALLCGPMAGIPLRWGLTGTIPKDDFEFMALLSSIGPVIGEIRAAELQELGVLANCEVEVLQLADEDIEYPDWDAEYKFLTTDATRLAWIADYCATLAQSGNTLILVERRETGFALERLIDNAVFVYGETKSKDRREQYDAIQISQDKVVIATYGIAAVGINIPRIFNLVLFHPGKAFVRTMQSIGRGLRTASDKDYVHIKDLTSTLKYSKRHLTKRKEFYREAGFPFILTKVDYR